MVLGSEDPAATGVAIQRPDDPDAAKDDEGCGAPKADHAVLKGAGQVHAEDAGNHGPQARCKAANRQRQLQAVHLHGHKQPG